MVISALKDFDDKIANISPKLGGVKGRSKIFWKIIYFGEDRHPLVEMSERTHVPWTGPAMCYFSSIPRFTFVILSPWAAKILWLQLLTSCEDKKCSSSFLFSENPLTFDCDRWWGKQSWRKSDLASKLSQNISFHNVFRKFVKKFTEQCNELFLKHIGSIFTTWLTKLVVAAKTLTLYLKYI